MKKFAKAYRFKVFIISAAILAAALSGCASAPKCKDITAPGNMGGYFNSPADEFSPTVADGAVYFATTQNPKSPSLLILISEYKKNDFRTPSAFNEIHRLGFKNIGAPTFYASDKTGEQELYFSAESKSGKPGVRDIYLLKITKGKWGTPSPLSNVNSEYRDLYPTISPDGAMLVFSSDRPGGEGELDLYLSRRLPDGSWSAPINLGKGINSDLNEITPFISQRGDLYFSTRALSLNGSYDIAKAEAAQQGWGAAKTLAFPINTEFDETGPAVFENKLIFASNRPGGCGGYDLYMFDNCGPAVLEVRVVSQTRALPLSGKARLLDDNKKAIAEKTIDESGICRFPIELNKSYIVQYSNDCFKDASGERKFEAPCSEGSAVKLVATFVLPLPAGEMRFDELKIPFFVSGYYRVNTKSNLEALRRLFAYNLLGTSDSTRYIENPGPEYDKYISEVESALQSATIFLSNRLELLSGECMKGDEKIRIIVTGFADERPFSKVAIYSEDSINDNAYNVSIRRGEKMTNDLLSRLRAYFVAKYIEQSLASNTVYAQLKDRIIWEVEGRGVDKNIKYPHEFKRRVNLKILLEKH